MFKRLHIVFYCTAIIFFLIGVTSGSANNTFDGVTFSSDWVKFGSFQLKNGKYREPAAPGSAGFITISLTDHISYGQSDGRKTVALVLRTDTPGSGIFYDVVVLIYLDDGWQKVGSGFLGDRIKVEKVEIIDNLVKLEWVAPAPNESMTGSGIRKYKTVSLHGQTLEEAAIEKENVSKPEIKQQSVQEDQDPLLERVWTWQKSMYNNDTNVEISHPEHYTLKLLSDGTLSAQVDCNRAGGTYTREGNQINLEITHSTRAMCPPESLDTVFLKDLEAVYSFKIQDSMLHLEMRYDTGIMFFK
jgi:heat shock protein HslJ